MAGGRPPNLFSQEQCDELGKDLLLWIENEGKDEVMFVRWYYDKHNMYRDDWEALIKREQFRVHYEIARKKLVSNMMKNETIAQSYGNRYLGLYDRDIRDHEKTVMQEKIEADLSAKISFEKRSDQAPNHLLIAALLEQVKDLRGKLGLQPLNSDAEKKTVDALQQSISAPK